MKQYQDLVRHILETGKVRSDRTGTGTIGVFGYQCRFDLAEGFPLVTTKRTHTKSILAELLWLISGSTNIKPLVDQGVSIWTDWPLKKYNGHLHSMGEPTVTLEEFEASIRASEAFARIWGDLGPVYGEQWRFWPAATGQVCADGVDFTPDTIDQLAQAIEQICTNPNSRRIIVSAWNPADIEDMALPPCHAFFQFQVEGGRLNCMLTQRSADVGLGVPFNWASYAALTMMVAQVTALQPGELIWSGGDTHIYLDHVEKLKKVLDREPRALPRLKIWDRNQTIDNFLISDFSLEGYDPHPGIKLEVSV